MSNGSGVRCLPTVKFKKLREDAILPTYSTRGSAAADVYALEDTFIGHSQRTLIPLGFACAVPEGYALLVCSRSGLALKEGLIVANQPGIIDSDYRGEVGVILYNTGGITCVKKGQRIAQLLLIKTDPMGIQVVDELDETGRTGGFGSTGS